MTIDNFDQIISMLKFDDKDKFYYLQILQRKKDNKGKKLGPNNNSRSIKTYYIDSLESLEERRDEIIALCELFNARASIRLNRRSYMKVAFRTLVKIANIMANGEYSHVGRARSKALGECHDEKSGKTWILDLDKDENGKFSHKHADLITHIAEQQPVGEKIVASIPSKNGMHVICKPFDLRFFKDIFPDIEIHKDNPTNLYIP